MHKSLVFVTKQYVPYIHTYTVRLLYYNKIGRTSDQTTIIIKKKTTFYVINVKCGHGHSFYEL